MFGASDTWCLSAVEDKNGAIFVFTRIATKHLGDIILNLGIVTGATGRKNIGDAVDGTGGHVIFGFDEGNLADVVEI